MLRIAICDDERIFSKNIEEILLEYTKEKEMLCEIDIFNSGKEFVDLGIEMIKYNIVFLDISMADMDGLYVAKKIREVSNEIFIVFVTAYENFAFDGYKVDAVRYILKNNINFVEAIYECMDSINIKMNYVVKRKTFHFNEGTKRVSLDHLLYIESRLHRLEFYIMEDGLNKYTMYGTLNELEKEFLDNDFVRTHQSYLINLKYVKNVNRYTVLLSNGMLFNIPRSRYKYVEEKFITYKGEI